MQLLHIAFCKCSCLEFQYVIDANFFVLIVIVKKQIYAFLKSKEFAAPT